ncbi:MAG: macro domain-containing protein [Planctomycetota bacterium]
MKHGDILDEPADLLICSANGNLDLSGGVGAALRMCFGPQMQKAAHEARRARVGSGPLPPGEFVVVDGTPSPFKHVIHLVGVTTFYDADAAVIARAIGEALAKADALGAASVALTAIATGYGPLSMAEFGEAASTCTATPYEHLAHVTVVVRHPHQAQELAAAMGLKAPRSD